VAGRALARAALAVACLAAAIGLQMARDRAYPRQQAQERALMYVRSVEAMRRIALSFDTLAADVYWIRALQHYGGDRRDLARTNKYELLYPLLDLATSLDPYFSIAYRFGAIFLSEPYPSGAGRPDLGIALLKKGLAVQPTRWQYHHDIAFVYYWQVHDMESAATWFRSAASQPGAPNWLEPLAAATLIQGGERASARVLFQEILKSEEKWLQQVASRSLDQITALDDVDLLNQAAAKFPPPPGQPYSWEWLGRRGVLRYVPPPDPTGTPYEIEPATGKVSVSPRSPLQPMPDARRLR
jgi:hypothetical protein